MSSAVDNLRQSEASLRVALEETGAVFKGKECRCPFHEDKTPSGGIYEKDGVWRFKCHTASVVFMGMLWM